MRGVDGSIDGSRVPRRLEKEEEPRGSLVTGGNGLDTREHECAIEQ
jgi:hypothetical protein